MKTLPTFVTLTGLAAFFLGAGAAIAKGDIALAGAGGGVFMLLIVIPAVLSQEARRRP